MAEETNLSQEITVDQDNPDQDSKSQNISSEKNTDSKDKNENDGSDRGDEIEPSEDGKTEDLQEDEDKAKDVYKRQGFDVHYGLCNESDPEIQSVSADSLWIVL